jgi:hypothetical protein
MTSAICIAENKRGHRCTRLAAPGGLLCALHERTHSTPEMYEKATLNFLRDAVAAGRKLDPELAVALFLELLADDEIRERGFQAVEEMKAEDRLAKSAPRPHPVAQNQKRETQPQGGTHAPRPDPPPALDDGVELVFLDDMVEEVE